MPNPENSPQAAAPAAAGGFSASLRKLWLAVLVVPFIVGATVAGLMVGGFGRSTQQEDSSRTESPTNPDVDLARIPGLNAGPIPSLDQGQPVSPEPPPLPLDSNDRIEQISADPRSLPSTDILAAADELLFGGNYTGALDACQDLAQHLSGLHAARARFRIALCEEALGNLTQAMTEYQQVVALAPGPAIREAALLGQARVWKLRNQDGTALKVLYRTLLEELAQSPDAAESQLPHQLGSLAAARVTPNVAVRSDAHNPLHDLFLATTVLTIRPDQVLEDLNRRELSSSAAPREEAGDQIVVLSRFSDAPDEISLQVRLPRLPALELVRRIAAGCDWSLRFSDTARERLQEHTLQPECRDLSLAIILDSILSGFDLIWRVTPEGLHILPVEEATPGELRDYYYQSARRVLTMATVAAPDNRWAANSFVELGRVNAIGRSVEEGVLSLTNAINQFPRERVIALAWFNRGKLYLRQGRLNEGIEDFRRAMDMLGGHPFEAVAYLYAGRIRLEQDAPREAILPLTRALALSVEGPVQGAAACLLASAYLMLDHYERANQVLVDHKRSLTSGEILDPAAFLASLIRFRAAYDEIERNRQGSQLLISMTNLNVSRCFGGHWAWLAGMAFRDTGMVTEEINVFQKCLSEGYNFPLQRRMRIALLADSPPGQVPDFSMRENSPDAQRELQPVRVQAQLARAVVASQEGREEETLRLCRELLTDAQVPEEPRREALRIMGRVYQRRGEHQKAVDCFTGVLPRDDVRQDPPRAQILPTGQVQR